MFRSKVGEELNLWGRKHTVNTKNRPRCSKQPSSSGLVYLIVFPLNISKKIHRNSQINGLCVSHGLNAFLMHYRSVWCSTTNNSHYSGTTQWKRLVSPDREKGSNLYVLDEHLKREEDREKRRQKSFDLFVMLQKSQQLVHCIKSFHMAKHCWQRQED